MSDPEPIPPAGPMTVTEAWIVLEAYRFARPRLVTAVLTLLADGVMKARIADAAGMTRAGITNLVERNRRRISTGGPGATCGNVAPGAVGQSCATVTEEVH